jgi:hypothetical protein
MTFYTKRLIRIRGDEPWDESGAGWWQHADAITDLGFLRPQDSSSPPEWLQAHKRRSLDWGAVLVEVSRDDVLRLTESTPNDHGSESWQQQRQLLADLPDGCYGVIWIEDTESQVRPGQRFEHRPDAHIPPFVGD